MMRWLGPVGWCLLPLCLGVVVVVWGINPWFLDEPLSFFVLCGFPLVLAGLVWGGIYRQPGGARGVILSAVLAVLAIVRPAPSPAGVDLLIVGIDGATWDVADGLDLPALQELQARGQRGVLLGEEPFFSPLLWTTMATGKRPAEHGIRGFRVSADHARAARFWDVVADAGGTVGLYKWLVTHPPPSGGGGFVVPAWLAPDARTHPAHLSWVKELELSRRLKRKRVDATRPSWQLILAGIADGLRWSTVREGLAFKLLSQDQLPASKRGPVLHQLRELIDRDVFIAQMHRKQPRVATLTLYATDALGHSHWGINGNHILHQAYRLADAVLGEAVRAAGPGATVLVLSDHGFRAAAPGDRQKRRRATTEGLRARLAEEVGPVDVGRLGHKLTVSTLEQDPALGLVRLRDWLALFRVDQTGLPLYRVESVPGQDFALGLTLRQDAFDPVKLARLTVGGQALSDFVSLAAGQKGEHDPRGIVVLAGPDIPPGSLGEVSQLDVAPTILAVLGLPAAADMPGRSWVPEVAARVPTYDHLAPNQEAADSPAEVDEQQLRALGYVE
jgi:hypothetical protein